MATTINHGQIAHVNVSGDVDIFYPKTFSKDVYINSDKVTLEAFIGSTSKTTLIDTIYPIGSIYMSVNDTNPSGFIGGTWVTWGSGRVPVGVSTDTEFNTVEKTGGEKTHTLTGAESGQKNLGNVTSSENGWNHTHGIGGGAVWSGTMNQNTSHQHRTGVDNAWGSVSTSSYGGVVAGVDRQSGTVSKIAGAYDLLTAAAGIDHQHLVPDHGHTCGTASANHTHYVTIGASNATNAHNNLQPYITCYMFKRTA